jgi:hypothetical protein
MNTNSAVDSELLPIDVLPLIFPDTCFILYHHATAYFYAPCNPSGEGGMWQEHIHVTPSWFEGPPCYDTIYLETDSSQPGIQGLHVAHTQAFFSFKHNNVFYPCALIRWFDFVYNYPDTLTGLWVVKPAILQNELPFQTVIHTDTILQAAHLIPVYGNNLVPDEIEPYHTLDIYKQFYVNRFIDYHAYCNIF